AHLPLGRSPCTPGVSEQLFENSRARQLYPLWAS
ncbi:hypothetical protein NPIL_322541, partial [Nephila pilipes]